MAGRRSDPFSSHSISQGRARLISDQPLAMRQEFPDSATVESGDGLTAKQGVCPMCVPDCEHRIGGAERVTPLILTTHRVTSRILELPMPASVPKARILAARAAAVANLEGTLIAPALTAHVWKAAKGGGYSAIVGVVTKWRARYSDGRSSGRHQRRRGT